jgi:outer membrane protein OmpA-like peptidoglycan-associated protein
MNTRTGGRRAALVALALLGGMAGEAPAQNLSTSIDVQRFKPGPGGSDLWNVHGAGVPGHLSWSVGLYLNFANHPLGLVDPSTGTTVIHLVGSQTALDLLGSVGLFDWLELGASLPVTYQTSQQPSETSILAPLRTGIAGAGVGDLRIVPKARLLQMENGLRLALAVPLTLPTATTGFLGTGGFGVRPRLAADFTFRDGIRIAAQAGVNLHRTGRLLNLTAGHELAYGLGAEIPFRIDRLRLAGLMNLAGASGLQATDREERYLEWLVGLRYQIHDQLAANVGAGAGIGRGYGSPDFRLLAGIIWTAVAKPAAAAPPPAPPADNPDVDGDGILNEADLCPYEAETKNERRDEDGCPDAHLAGADAQGGDALALLRLQDADGDGLQDHLDRCPAEPEDADGFEDAEGCPDPDNDRDGIPDGKDSCPLEAESINGVTDDDGCPDRGQAKVVVQDRKIVILEKVYFATNKDVILPRSFPLLKQVAAVLRANPEIELVRVEGHTDSQGRPEWNQDLSQRRAANVRSFLIQEGIDGSRLEAVGYGQTRPVDTNRTAKGRENNRRVEFNILKPAAPPAEGQTP